MGVATTIVMMGMALASGAAAYSSSRTAAKRAEKQGEIAARQGELELKRSAQSAEEAVLELEDAQEYQQWKDDFVVPALEKSISDPRQSDPAALRAKQNLGRGIAVEGAQDTIAQGITGAGFDFGGNRQGAADAEISGSLAGASVAGLGAAHESVKQQGISNTGSLVNAGRQVYKQQGIV
jgi:hypothetical protein